MGAVLVARLQKKDIRTASVLLNNIVFLPFGKSYLPAVKSTTEPLGGSIKILNTAALAPIAEQLANLLNGLSPSTPGVTGNFKKELLKFKGMSSSQRIKIISVILSNRKLVKSGDNFVLARKKGKARPVLKSGFSADDIFKRMIKGKLSGVFENIYGKKLNKKEQKELEEVVKKVFDHLNRVYNAGMRDTKKVPQMVKQIQDYLSSVNGQYKRRLKVARVSVPSTKLFDRQTALAVYSFFLTDVDKLRKEIGKIRGKPVPKLVSEIKNESELRTAISKLSAADRMIIQKVSEDWFRLLFENYTITDLEGFVDYLNKNMPKNKKVTTPWMDQQLEAMKFNEFVKARVPFTAKDVAVDLLSGRVQTFESAIKVLNLENSPIGGRRSSHKLKQGDELEKARLQTAELLIKNFCLNNFQSRLAKLKVPTSGDPKEMRDVTKVLSEVLSALKEYGRSNEGNVYFEAMLNAYGINMNSLKTDKKNFDIEAARVISGYVAVGNGWRPEKKKTEEKKTLFPSFGKKELGK